MQLAGKTVLLTGASGGIGQAIATRLAQAGAHLQVVGRDAGRLEQVRRTLAGAHQIVVADINTAAGRDELFLRCQENGLDVLINAAVVALNRALGNSADSPERVAAELMKMLADTPRQRFMGWPENIFVRLNGLFPGIVHHALVKKLPIIRQHAANHEQGS